MDLLRYLGRRCTRTDDVTPSDTRTCMRRELGLVQLTLLGIGSTIGAGIYVIIGVTTRDIAGPAIVASFVIAGIATFMTSMCFAQYALRISRGSLYMYVVCTYGELIAFVVTWESMTGAGLMASVTAQGFSSYLDSFLDARLSNLTREYIGQIPLEIGDILLEFPDVIAGITAILCTLLVSFVSVTYFASVTSILAVLNSVVLIVFVGIGLSNADVTNWTNIAHGGFIPFGFRGILKASSVCISAYAGFKCICMAAEETKNPAKTVPRSLAISSLITSIVYTLVAIAFTLLVPFWLVGVKSPLVDALEFANSLPWALSMIVQTGPIFGMLCAMTLTIYGVSRLLYSMADNGLMWVKFAQVTKGRQIPTISSITVGLFVAVIATSFDISKLVSAIALGALMTMVILSFGAILLMYKPRKTYEDQLDEIIDYLIVSDTQFAVKSHLESCVHRVTGIMTSPPIHVYVTASLFLSLISSSLLTFALDDLYNLNPIVMTSLILCMTCLVVVCLVMSRYPRREYPGNDIKPLPGGPLLPVTSGFVNTLFFVGGCDVTTITIFFALNASGLLLYFIACVVDYVRGTSKILPRFYTRLSIEEQGPVGIFPQIIPQYNEKTEKVESRNYNRELLPLGSYEGVELYAY